jgi:hypothetical protein
VNRRIGMTQSPDARESQGCDRSQAQPTARTTSIHGVIQQTTATLGGLYLATGSLAVTALVGAIIVVLALSEAVFSYRR